MPRPQVTKAPSFGRRLYQFWDMALAYMPLMMLSLLLLLSIWLVRNAPTNPQVEPPAPVTHTPDYEFSHFTLRSFDINGKILSVIKGEKAQHFQDTLNTLVASPEVWIFSDKRLTQASAKQALTNEDGSQVQLMGAALVQRGDMHNGNKTEQIASEFLHYYANTDTVVTHLPVSIIRGQDRFFADSLRADHLNQLLYLNGRVKVQIVPTPSP
ncbi:MAG: LPS export ABC transporter periplasmic protein LptC [Limnohabitans sp.]